MIQLTELQSMRDTLQRTIFSGTLRVQFADRAAMAEQGNAALADEAELMAANAEVHRL